MTKLIGICLVVVLFSCATSRNATPSRIGVLPLESYTATAMVTDTVYQVFTTEADFEASFQAINGAKKPDFYGQMVVGITLPKASSGLLFERAEIMGKVINVYASSCTSTQPGCGTKNTLVAALPKVGNASRVQFFINGVSRRIQAL